MNAPSLNIVQIEDPGDTRIAEYANLTDSQLLARALDPDRSETGLFMAEGELVVRQAIASSVIRLRSVLLTPTRIRTMRDALEQLPPEVPIYSAAQGVMDQITGFHIHRGILASGLRPPQPDLERLLASVRTVVVLENLANHDNVGGIFRTTATLAGIPVSQSGGRSERSGAAVLYSPRTCDPLYRKAIRVSLGSALHVPFARLDRWPEDLRRLKKAGFTLIALTPDASALPLSELDQNSIRNPALLLGSEGMGLSAEAFAASDLKVRIPVCPPMDSLNVVVAAGIALHALVPGN